MNVVDVETSAFFYVHNNIHEKLINSDWLGVVQFGCNTSAKSVTPVQITHRYSGLWLAERQQEIF